MNISPKQFINHLICPISKSTLREMHKDEIESVNIRISNQELNYRDEQKIINPINEGLVTTDGRFFYSIESDIISLIPNRAIDLHQISSKVDKNEISDLKKNVQDFYDQVGWKKIEDTNEYIDSSLFSDSRNVSQNYFHKCHQRINKYLDGGKYILDIASGAIPHKEYIEYSSKYEFRICVDFSMLALKEAKEKLGDKGIYILADITNIPIVENCIDTVISLHTVYHVPQYEQSKACSELYRVLKPNGSALIVYTWSESDLMNMCFSMTMFIGRLKKLVKSMPNLLHGKEANTTPNAIDLNNQSIDLYFKPQNYRWFQKEIKSIGDNVSLKVWSSVSLQFIHVFINERYFGKQILDLIYFLEDLFPYVMGRIGQYPIFLIKK